MPMMIKSLLNIRMINSAGSLLSRLIILISPILAKLFVSTCLFSIFRQNFNTLFLISQCLRIVVRRISETFLFLHALNHLPPMLLQRLMLVALATSLARHATMFLILPHSIVVLTCQTFKIRQDINWSTTNLIYLITCSRLVSNMLTKQK